MTLKLDKLTYRTENGACLLDSMQEEWEREQIVVVAGQAGAGKSTLLQMLAGILPPEEENGSLISYDGRALWKNGKPDRKVLMQIGYTDQHPEKQFFLPTVREELRYSLKPYRLGSGETERRIREASEACGLGEELLEMSPFFLSGGQKRRAALASVLAAGPQWLILDEPTAGLDPSMGEWLAEQLVRYKKGRGGVIIATHDLDLFLPIADRVVLLKEGRHLGSWSVEELVRSPKQLERAGIGIPDCIRLTSLITMSAPGATKAARIAGADLMPDMLAEVWAARLQAAAASSVEGELSPIRRSEISAPAAVTPNQPADPGPIETPNRIRSLDPRVKWGGYLLFSLAVLFQPVWPVTAAALLMTALAARLAGLTVRFWARPLLPMMGFMLLSFLVSGVELHGLTDFPGFDPLQGETTLERLAALVPVMAAGILFGAVTDPQSIQKGLQAPFRAVPGLRRTGEILGTAVSVLFRFLRYIPGEMERFSRLAAVRGKKGGRPGRLRLRELPSFFTPMLLSVMQYAEELSLALESRGYRRLGQERTNAAPLRWTRKDGTALGMIAAASLILVVIGWIAR